MCCCNPLPREGARAGGDTLTAERILRLNTLLHRLEAWRERGIPVASDDLIREAGYLDRRAGSETAKRLLQRDIGFLRDRFCAEIVYDGSAGGYFLESLGEYVLLSIIGVPESCGAA